MMYRRGKRGSAATAVWAMAACGLLLGGGAAFAIETELSPFKSTGEKFALKEGEQLTYSIHWMGMTVGQAIMRVREITDCMISFRSISAVSILDCRAKERSPETM